MGREKDHNPSGPPYIPYSYVEIVGEQKTKRLLCF